MTSQQFDGLKGLLTADPAAIAALLLVQSFADGSGEVKSHVPHAQLDRALAELGGFRFKQGVFRANDDGVRVNQLTLECCLYWERALLAARSTTGTDSTTNEVFLLRRGTSLLASGDPVRSVQQVMVAVAGWSR